MPNINLSIHSLSILFLFTAIALMVWYPDKPFSPSLVHALFWWFLALGIVKWIERGILDIAENNEGNIGSGVWYWTKIPFLILQILFLVLGIASFFSALATL